jgi:antitoxin component of RelBE/YafQ-DinJ toxin-antitoxin module
MNGSCILCYIIFVIRLFLFYRKNTGTIPVEQKQPYDKNDITQNTGTIPVEQKQPYDKYHIAQNTGTIHVEQKQ